MEPATRRLIEAIHAAPLRCVLAVTGGGTRAVAMLLDVPGGSRTILEAIVPYHERSLVEFLGRRPASFCTEETSLALATRARSRASWLAPGEAVVGLGCTASLVSDRPKRGDHRFYVATDSELGGFRCSLTLTKGARDRDGEEAVVDAAILNALAAAFGIAERVDVPLLPDEALQWQAVVVDQPLARLLLGNSTSVCVTMDGQFRTDAKRPAALVAGSFNPIHAGHWQLAEVAAGRTGGNVAFELSMLNVDKPPLTAEEIRRRLAQFTCRADVWLTRAPTFAEKAMLFPGVIFVVGADTALRLVQPRYYGNSEEAMTAALAGLRARGCSFLVAGRVDDSGQFVELDRLAIPAEHRDLFAPIPAAECRIDLSSTALRESACRSPVAGSDADG
jgi:hypothetical protein